MFIPLYFVAIGARMNPASLTLNSFIVVFVVSVLLTPSLLKRAVARARP